jgi:uncharacterized protein (DUF2062 family)
LKPPKSKHPLRELLYRIRTEGDTPGRQAGAVGAGVFIGCTPFYGLHLALCIVVAKIFRLNQILTYLAAHVSLPGVWPLLVFAQLQLGRRLRGEPFLALRLSEIKSLNLEQFGLDLLLGSTVVGACLAVPLALLTLVVARRRQEEPTRHALIEQSARRYLEAGMFDWEFARGKLRHDPLYLHMLRRGLLPADGLLLDLGCGRALLPALVLTARDLHARGLYPEGWAPPPAGLRFHGLEGRPKAAAAARQALGDEAVIETADLREAGFPTARALLLLDVLHYLPAAAQEELLARAVAALEPGGVLFIRDADAAGGWRFTATRIQERLATMARRQLRQRFHYRSTAEWRALLTAHGLEVSAEPMSMGTPYANVLLQGKRPSL